MTLRARDIPLIAGLGSIKLLTGEQSQQAIRWPYLAENRELAPWLVGGELVFVTGINLQRSEAEYCQLIDEAMEKSAAGIVILTDSEFIESIPVSVLDYAKAKGFAILEQPYSLPMVRVTELICNALIQDNLSSHSLQHFASEVVNSPSALSALSQQRARDLGIDLNQPMAIALIQPEQHSESNLSAWLFQLKQWLQAVHSPYPPLEYHHGWYLLLPLSEHDSIEQQRSHWQGLRQHLQLQQLSFHLGISASLSGWIQLGQAAQQAKQAAEFAQLQQHNAIVHYLDLGISRVFAAVEDSQLLVDFCRLRLGPLFANQQPDISQLKHTLRCYFDNLGSLRQTAQELNIHRNTLHNRLSKVQALTGCQLNHAQQRLELHNALLMEPLAIQRQRS